MTRSKKTIARDAQTGQFVEVKTTIPPHVANVLMRELGAETPQEAVDKVLAIYTEKGTSKKRKAKS